MYAESEISQLPREQAMTPRSQPFCWEHEHLIDSVADDPRPDRPKCELGLGEDSTTSQRRALECWSIQEQFRCFG